MKPAKHDPQGEKDREEGGEAGGGDPGRFLNRELQWLAFNRRVLEEAQRESHPLLERVKFEAIFASNLAEFFLIRFSGVHRQILRGVAVPSPDGRTPAEQIRLLREAILPDLAEHRRIWNEDLLPLLRDEGISVEPFEELREEEKQYLGDYFDREIFPVLTPQAVDPGRPFPHISSGSLNLLVALKDEKGNDRHARVKLPRAFPRFVPVPDVDGEEEPRIKRFVWLEDLVAASLATLFPGYAVDQAYPFQLLRDADLEIQEDEAPDLLATVAEGVEQRYFGMPVAILIRQSTPERVVRFLADHLELRPYQIFPVDGRVCMGDLMELYALDRRDLKDVPFTPALPGDLARGESFAEVLRWRDQILFHPYDSFSPVVDFLTWAARDPQVLAIKMTLYRVGHNSPVVEALMDARHHGKQVAAMVELKARFDEKNNIVWARALERVGVHVVYGLVGLKVHAKMCLVVRRETGGIRKYVHLGTGNYNPSTASVYSDMGLFTADEDIGEDVASLFNVITGYARQKDYRKLLVAPGALRGEMRRRIDREIERHRRYGDGYLAFKMNALVDPECIDALYRASQAGVPIDLQVRGTCCLRPGVPGLSETITVTSIVGRFLEHVRMYYFRAGGGEDEELFLGSADLMERNLDRRVEVLFPIQDPALRRVLCDEVLQVHLKDTARARLLQPDGSYVPRYPREGEPGVHAQRRMVENRGIWHIPAPGDEI